MHILATFTMMVRKVRMQLVTVIVGQRRGDAEASAFIFDCLSISARPESLNRQHPQPFAHAQVWLSGLPPFASIPG
jgi:hypothetical protein